MKKNATNKILIKGLIVTIFLNIFFFASLWFIFLIAWNITNAICSDNSIASVIDICVKYFLYFIGLFLAQFVWTMALIVINIETRLKLWIWKD